MPAPAIDEIGYLSANVGFCSTYSIFTRSGPQTKTASVFGASTTSATSMPSLLRVLERLVRRVDEHGEMVQERLLGISRLTLMELDERAADLDPRLVLGREAEIRVGGRGLLRALREQRDVVEVVVHVGLALDDAQAQTLGDVEVGARRLPGRRRDHRALRELLRGRSRGTRRASAPRARAAPPRRRGSACRAGRRPHERELLSPLDDVHRQPLLRKSAMRSRSATQRATWSRVLGLIAGNLPSRDEALTG